MVAAWKATYSVLVASWFTSRPQRNTQCTKINTCLAFSLGLTENCQSWIGKQKSKKQNLKATEHKNTMQNKLL